MKNSYRMLAKIFCLTLILATQGVLAGSAFGAQGQTVLVLPFQANAGPEMPNASQSIPNIIAEQIKQSGLAAVPMGRASTLLRNAGGGSVNLNLAREM